MPSRVSVPNVESEPESERNAPTVMSSDFFPQPAQHQFEQIQNPAQIVRPLGRQVQLRRAARESKEAMEPEMDSAAPGSPSTCAGSAVPQPRQDEKPEHPLRGDEDDERADVHRHRERRGVLPLGLSMTPG